MTLSEFRIRFPELNDVSDDTILLYISDAEKSVNVNCANSDLMIAYLSAHYISVSGTSEPLTPPVTGEKIGSLSFTYSDNTLGDGSTFGSTAYGQRYEQMLRDCAVGQALMV